MDIFILALYNLVMVGVAFTGLVIERRRPRVGIALLLVALTLLLNLFVGGALLFVPFILALYGVMLGLPAFALWRLVQMVRRRGGRSTPPVPDVRIDS